MTIRIVFDDIPPEIKAKVFQLLGPVQLSKCLKVSAEWRKVIKKHLLDLPHARTRWKNNNLCELKELQHQLLMAVAADNHTAVAEICDVNFLDLNEEVSTNIIGLKHDVMTPLMVAARSNSVKSAGVLLRQESIDVEQSSGMLRRLYIAGKRLPPYTVKINALQMAAWKGSKGVVELLVGKSMGVLFATGHRALRLAAGMNNVDIVRMILPHCDVNAGSSRLTALHAAAGNGAFEAVRVLLEVEGININVCDREEGLKTPLYVALKNGHHEVAELLASDPRLELRNYPGLLNLAMRENASRMICHLMTRPKFRERLVDEKGNTALHLAVSGSRLAAVGMLMQGSRQWRLASRQNREKDTPVHLAVWAITSKSTFICCKRVGTDSMWEEVMKHLAKFQDLCKNHQEALIELANYADLLGMVMLMTNLKDKRTSAKVSSKKKIDELPLHAAIKKISRSRVVSCGHTLYVERALDVAMMLLSNLDAFSEARDWEGRTCVELAKEAGLKELAKMIKAC